jgi:hypothetical protein
MPPRIDGSFEKLAVELHADVAIRNQVGGQAPLHQLQVRVRCSRSRPTGGLELPAPKLDFPDESDVDEGILYVRRARELGHDPPVEELEGRPSMTGRTRRRRNVFEPICKKNRPSACTTGRSRNWNLPS